MKPITLICLFSLIFPFVLSNTRLTHHHSSKTKDLGEEAFALLKINVDYKDPAGAPREYIFDFPSACQSQTYTLDGFKTCLSQKEYAHILTQLNWAKAKICANSFQSRWITLKGKAIDSKNPDAVMIPFLRLRELIDVFLLSVAVDNYSKNSQWCTVAKDRKAKYEGDLTKLFSKTTTFTKLSGFCQDATKTDVFEALKAIKTVDDIKFNINGQEKLIYKGTTLVVTGKSAGSLSTFSDVDQTIISNDVKQRSSLESVLAGFCAQSEIIKYFDVGFSEMFDNSSYDTFDLNVYFYGIFELETFDLTWRSVTCPIRDNKYKDNNLFFSLMGLRTAYSHWKDDALVKNTIKPEITKIKAFLDGKVNAQDKWAAKSFLMTDKLSNLKDTKNLVGEASGQGKILGVENVMKLTNPLLLTRSDKQKIFYLRNTAYFFKLCYANKLFEEALNAQTDKAADVITRLKKAFYDDSSSEYQRTFLEAEYITNEAMYTGGSVVVVVGSQIGAKNAKFKENFKEHELAQSFYVNLGTALDHFLDFFKEFHEQTNENIKDYFLYEALVKLAKYLDRAKGAATEYKYKKNCNGDEATLLNSVNLGPKFKDITAWGTSILDIKKENIALGEKIKKMKAASTKYKFTAGADGIVKAAFEAVVETLTTETLNVSTVVTPYKKNELLLN